MHIGYSPSLEIYPADTPLLKKTGCEKVFESQSALPNPHEAIAFARPQDTLVVTQLSHLSHSLKTLLEILQSLEKKNIHLQCLHPPLHTKTFSPRDLYQALTAFPKEVAREKAQQARTIAKEKGERGGRPPKIPTEVLEAAQTLYEKKTPIRKICQTLRIGKSSFYRNLKPLPPENNDQTTRG